MNNYILSKKTQEDIDAIYEFGVLQFGEDQALNYLIELRVHFELLLKNPEIVYNVVRLKKNFTVSTTLLTSFLSHSKNYLRIVRVLHGSRDLRKFLK
ncbi:type II toxin-antitoxin system RelE/ParE family toxin [Leeuwenhoekiella sp. LLG6367-2.1]|uniref:type II toxin-antitoxin system RelE/ParE family toxin n=1 Tax=Leeuwenhoekiella sp. LLG6367-2.1 TaxID=3160833 RepID=UPI00386876B8